MKRKEFSVDIFEWDVVVLELNRQDKADNVISILEKELGEDWDECYNDVRENIDKRCYDGGAHFYVSDKKKSLILIYPTTSKHKRINVLCHEKRHLEDRILQNSSGIKDIETAGYLAGYLAEKIL